MPEYRVYRIKDGHTAGVPAILSCDTDQEAIEKANQLLDGLDVELWQGARVVAKIPAASGS